MTVVVFVVTDEIVMDCISEAVFYTVAPLATISAWTVVITVDM